MGRAAQRAVPLRLLKDANVPSPDLHATRMKRLLAFLICLAAVWLLCCIGMEFFIAWHRDAETELALRMQIDLALQVLVDVAALALGWRVVRGPRGGNACFRVVRPIRQSSDPSPPTRWTPVHQITEYQ